MDHIDACVCPCAEITGENTLGSVGFLYDVTDPAALAEVVSAGANVNHTAGKSSSDVGCVQLSTILEWWKNLVGARSIYGRIQYRGSLGI